MCKLQIKKQVHLTTKIQVDLGTMLTFQAIFTQMGIGTKIALVISKDINQSAICRDLTSLIVALLPFILNV